MHISTVPFEWHPVKIKNSPITSAQSTRKVGTMSNDCTTSQADTPCATCGVAYRRTRRYGTDLSCLARCTFSARNGVADFIDCRSATQKRRALVVCQHTEWTCTSRKRVSSETASTHHQPAKHCRSLPTSSERMRPNLAATSKRKRNVVVSEAALRLSHGVCKEISGQTNAAFKHNTSTVSALR